MVECADSVQDPTPHTHTQITLHSMHTKRIKQLDLTQKIF